MSKEEFDVQGKKLRTARDKFIAHDLAYADARLAYTGEPEVRYSGGRGPQY